MTASPTSRPSRRGRPAAAPVPGTAGLLALASPFPGEAGTVFLLEPPDACAAALAERLRRGEYDRPFLLEQDGIRSLHFGLGFTQSAFRLAEPDALHLAYTRAMAAFLLFRPRPRHVLLLGLGGGSLVRFCRRHLPATRITAVEVDPDVIAFRDACRVPPDGELFRLVEADGACHVARTADRYDVILVDAFDRQGVAPTLATDAFFADALARLAAGGVLVMNIAGRRSDRDPLAARLAAAADGRILTLTLKSGGNRIAFAFRDPPAVPRRLRLGPAARALAGRTGCDFEAIATQMERENP